VSRLTTSAAILVAANSVPLYGVAFLDWEVFPLVLLFWLENVIVGCFNVLRILLVGPYDMARWIGKVFIAAFFVLHYGGFAAIHGMFVVLLFGGGYVPPGEPLGIEWLVDTVSRSGTVWAVVALVLSHGFSFVWNYVGHGEYRRVTIERLMMQPYARVAVLHIAIIGSGMLVVALGSPLAGLVLLVVLKIGLDLRAHLKEHGKAQLIGP
jgi:hypothetical protein